MEGPCKGIWHSLSILGTNLPETNGPLEDTDSFDGNMFHEHFNKLKSHCEDKSIQFDSFSMIAKGYHIHPLDISRYHRELPKCAKPLKFEGKSSGAANPEGVLCNSSWLTHNPGWFRTRTPLLCRLYLGLTQGKTCIHIIYYIYYNIYIYIIVQTLIELLGPKNHKTHVQTTPQPIPCLSSSKVLLSACRRYSKEFSRWGMDIPMGYPKLWPF